MGSAGHHDARVLEFKILRQEIQGGATPVALYEARLGDKIFAHLYLRPTTCVLVWKAPDEFSFDPKLPIEFLDTQFSGLTPSRIALLERSVPWTGSSMLHKPYKLEQYQATLAIPGKGLHKYNLMDHDVARYQSEIVEKRALVSFARFDSEMSYQGRLINYLFTAERLRHSTGEQWELTISLPRGLELKDATLRWIAKHHSVRDMREMNFKKSLVVLSEVINPQSELVTVL